ncbi:hypothetical protein [Halostella sp. PRR32]|uniref:hypothetical protein n=1 Tax=Halostella sp. PRR32 TaxID=3098147 RepID=UPI002B1DB481|nr:hypothetical protein [Halostella sp. PRR32]
MPDVTLQADEIEPGDRVQYEAKYWNTDPFSSETPDTKQISDDVILDTSYGDHVVDTISTTVAGGSSKTVSGSFTVPDVGSSLNDTHATLSIGGDGDTAVIPGTGSTATGDQFGGTSGDEDHNWMRAMTHRGYVFEYKPGTGWRASSGSLWVEPNGGQRYDDPYIFDTPRAAADSVSTILGWDTDVPTPEVPDPTGDPDTSSGSDSTDSTTSDDSDDSDGSGGSSSSTTSDSSGDDFGGTTDSSSSESDSGGSTDSTTSDDSTGETDSDSSAASLDLRTAAAGVGVAAAAAIVAKRRG